VIGQIDVHTIRRAERNAGDALITETGVAVIDRKLIAARQTAGGRAEALFVEVGSDDTDAAAHEGVQPGVRQDVEEHISHARPGVLAARRRRAGAAADRSGRAGVGAAGGVRTNAAEAFMPVSTLDFEADVAVEAIADAREGDHIRIGIVRVEPDARTRRRERLGLSVVAADIDSAVPARRPSRPIIRLGERGRSDQKGCQRGARQEMQLHS
jgi:hypothetical protein